MLNELTQNYIQAFNDKDLNTLSIMFDEHVVLEDPVLKRIEGRVAVLAAVERIFKSVARLSFTARNIYVDGSTSLIEFHLELDNLSLTGVDVIEWRDGKLCELRAYLDVPKK